MKSKHPSRWHSGQSRGREFTETGNILKLSEASYETLFRYQNDKDLLPDGEVESNEEDSEQDSEKDSRVDAVFGEMLLCTASRRPVIHPNRMDLQHITSTRCISFFSSFKFPLYLHVALQDTELNESLNFCTTLFFL